MQLRWGPHRRSPRLLALAGGPDLISTLPDDLLLLVLARLGCAAAAARTGVLSRRWRSLWAGLRRIVLRDVPFRSLEPALTRVPPPPTTVSLLEICLPESPPGCRVPKERLADTARVNSLLRAAARIDPEEFSLDFPSGLVRGCLVVDLPCFHRATSIVLELDIYNYGDYSTIRTGVEFPALQKLSLSCCTADVDALLSCCPRLRMLRLADVCFHKSVLRVNSPLLQELVVIHGTWINHATIIAPVLKQLTISLLTYQELNISVLAPMVENVSWDCHFSGHFIAFGPWKLVELNLQAAAAAESPPSLRVHACITMFTFPGEAENFTQEIEKHMVVEFSVLELHLDTRGHVYGALAFLLLGMNRIRSSMQKLKVFLHRPVAEEGCSTDCSCEPMDWRSQTIAFTALEEVEIDGFKGEEHEIDFLKLMFKYASMLKSIIVKLSHEAYFECRKIHDIFKACSPVEFFVSFTSDEYMFCRLD